MKIITKMEEIPKSGLVCLKFGATWCGPCKKLKPILEKLETEFKSVQFLEIDTDEAFEVTKHFNIKAVPCVVLIKNSIETDRITGLTSTEPLRKTLRDFSNI